MIARIVVAASIVASVGCQVQDEAALGRFDLEGSRTESCGDTGVIASPTTLVDTVYLREGSQSTLQWEDVNGLLVVNLGEGNSFSATRLIVVDLRPSDGPPGLPPCVVQRHDSISGVLEGDADSGYSGFEVELRYEFSPASGSSCGDLHHPDGLAAGLPCTIAYDAVGERVE